MWYTYIAVLWCPSRKLKQQEALKVKPIKGCISAQGHDLLDKGVAVPDMWCGVLQLQVYEAKGGSYENQDGSKNEPKKGAPEPKDKAKKEAAKKPGKV